MLTELFSDPQITGWHNRKKGERRAIVESYDAAPM
jgi:hypothetical protein